MKTIINFKNKNYIKNIIATNPNSQIPHEQSSTEKNSISIAIDFDREANPPIHVNIHTIINGKAKETYNVPYNEWENKSFKVLWDDIGENIQNHMTDNSDYNIFGS